MNELTDRLYVLVGKEAAGHRAQFDRDRLIRIMIDAGARQADAWRALNKAREAHGLPPVTRAAVEAIIRRTPSEPKL